jgi:hypothetical protein
MPHGPNARNFDPGIRAILEELRDLRLEMRADRRHAEATAAADRRRSDERFAQLVREFREDSARHHAETQQAFKGIRTVGLSIVKTLNHHTRLLERIDRKLG